MTNRITRAAQMLIVVMAMTACGTNSATPVGQSSASTTAPAPQATAASTTAGAPTAAAVVAPNPTVAAPTSAQGSPYADIEQGRTPEGYHFLGSANAPVTLVMYSDFF